MKWRRHPIRIFGLKNKKMSMLYQHDASLHHGQVVIHVIHHHGPQHSFSKRNHPKRILHLAKKAADVSHAAAADDYSVCRETDWPHLPPRMQRRTVFHPFWMRQMPMNSDRVLRRPIHPIAETPRLHSELMKTHPRTRG